MDLIYTDTKGIDVNVMPDCELDMAFGSDENDFECTVDLNAHCCNVGCILHAEDVDPAGMVLHTEYGGIIDGLKVNTADNSISYTGRTWHGILESKVLCPDAGQDYLILSGEANTVLALLISRMGLTRLFEASGEDSGIRINNYQMNRYIAGYTGIRKMLSSAGAKLVLRYVDGIVILSATHLVDYSKDEEWDSDQMDFAIEQKSRPVNHMVCLGKGDLKDREVIHLYTDAEGNISPVQTMFGTDEVTEVYDYPNVESSDELIKGGTERLQEAYAGAENLGIDFENNEDYDIGDIVGARENITGVFVSREIVKKIVKMNKNGTNIECQIGE